MFLRVLRTQTMILYANKHPTSYVLPTYWYNENSPDHIESHQVINSLTTHSELRDDMMTLWCQCEVYRFTASRFVFC